VSPTFRTWSTSSWSTISRRGGGDASRGADDPEDEATVSEGDDVALPEDSPELRGVSVESFAPGAPPHPPEHETDPTSEAHSTRTRALTSA
jgi:hypothetical protein